MSITYAAALCCIEFLNEVKTLAEIKQTPGGRQEPITNPFLVEAMNNMKAERSQKNEIIFVNALKPARLLVPAKIDSVQQARANEDGTVALVDQPQVRFLLFNNKEGSKFFPLFTDIDEYRKWDDAANNQLAAVNFRDLVTIMEKDTTSGATGCVINPFSHNITVPAETMKRMLQTEALAPGTKIQIGTFKEPPKELMNAVEAVAKEYDEIKKMYVRAMKREDKEHSNMLLVIDIDLTLGEETIKGIFDKLAQAAKGHTGGMELAIVPSAAPFGQQALQDGIEPFFEK